MRLVGQSFQGRSLGLALLFLLPLPALADCPGEVIFACPIKARVLEVCLTGTAAIYSYGKPGRPELTIATPLTELDYTPWPGIGSAIWEEARLQNAGVDYTVFTSIEKLGEDGQDPERQGGVAVTQGDQTLAQLACTAPPDPGALDALFQAITDAGRCWDFDSQSWQEACGD